MFDQLQRELDGKTTIKSKQFNINDRLNEKEIIASTEFELL